MAGSSALCITITNITTENTIGIFVIVVTFIVILFFINFATVACLRVSPVTCNCENPKP